MEQADALLVAGGDALSLCHWMRESGLADLIGSLTDTVWVGLSAGSMVLVAARTSSPPAPLDSRLVEEVVHGEDIRRPLGQQHDYPAEAVVRSLWYQARPPDAFGGAQQRIAGLRLLATDADVSVGIGSEVRGPVLSLLLVISGRRAALDDLDGPGATRLT